MSPAVFTDRVQCRLCLKLVHKFDVVGSSIRGYTCAMCLEWHFHAMDVLGGAAPRGCQECGRDWAALKEMAGGTEVRLYAVPLDGVYRLLCKPCAIVTVPKVRELYKGTEFASRAKLF